MIEKINLFLNKFKNIVPPERFIKREIVGVVKEIVGVVLHENNLKLKRNVVYISTQAVIKSEVFLHKKEILLLLSQRLSKYKQTVTDIR